MNPSPGIVLLVATLRLAPTCDAGDAKPAPNPEPSWMERIDQIHQPGYMDWITSAWATMLLKQGIISKQDAPEAARVVLQLWEFDFLEDERKWQQFYKNHSFIQVTNSRGGVAPEEVARMIAVRREKLAQARARHLERIETLEKAQQRLLADLRELTESISN